MTIIVSQWYYRNTVLQQCFSKYMLTWTISAFQVLDKMTVCTEDSRTDSQMKTSQKNETLSTSVAPWPAERDDQCEEMSTQSDNHSGI